MKSTSDTSYIQVFEEESWLDSYGYGELRTKTSKFKCTFSSPYTKGSDIFNALQKDDKWLPYLEQFISESETFEDFREYFKNDSWYYGCVYTGVNSDMENFAFNFGLSSMKVTSGLIPEKKEEGLGTIYSNTDSALANLNNDRLLPFFYTPKGEDKPPYIDEPPVPDGGQDPENAKDFICYREHKKPFISFSSHRQGSSIFTWKVEDYPEFANCFIEIRSTLLQGDSINGYKPRTSDFYYYSSVDESLKKASQNSLLKVPFIDGTVTCAERDMGDYFTGIEEFRNIAVSCPIRMQVRVLSEDRSIYSNWVTFDFGVDGQNLWTGTMDNDGNIIDENLSSIPGYDWDSDKNPGKYDYYRDGVSQNSTGTSGYDADFSGFLDGALQSVINFPTLLSTCYSWLPPEIITLIGVGLGMLIVLRILGR